LKTAELIKRVNNVTDTAYQHLFLLQKGAVKRLKLENIETLAGFYKEWLEFFVIDYQHHDKPVQDTGLAVTVSVFLTLSQLKFLTRYNDIIDYNPQLMNLKATPEDDEDVPAIWSFTQSEVMDAVFYLTQQMEMLALDEIDRFKTVIEALHVRNSVFFCEYSSSEVLDMESMRVENQELFHPNVQYMQFSTIYFRHIYHRLYFFDLWRPAFLDEFPIAIQTMRTQLIKAVKTKVCKFLGEDGVRDTYLDGCDQALEFCGDREWYSVLHPGLSPSLLNLLQMNRDNLVSTYMTAESVSKDPILLRTDLQDTTVNGLCARWFVLVGINKFISAYTSCPNWLGYVLIRCKDIYSKTSQIKIMQEKIPLLVQIFSRFCVFSKKRVWVTDCIYTAISAWFYVLERDYDNRLLSLDFTKVGEKLFPRKHDPRADREFEI